jgi:predicted RNA binding protein YcfA (HicA-like mRNA interferase family)
MATTSELLRRLRRAGFRLVENGSRHDIYEHQATGRRVIVPRHKREMPNGTYRAILKDAGLD